MKLLLKIVGGIVILFVAALLVVYFSLGIIVSHAITTLGPKMTLSPISVRFVSISPFTGNGRISGLTIDSPSGYKVQPAIKINDIQVTINLKSLFKDKIIINEVFIDAPEVNVEQKFTTNNISAIRSNVNSYTSASSGKSGRKFEVDHLVINNGKARLGTGSAQVLFPITNVDRTKIGAGSDGVTSSELTKIVFSTFTESVVKGMANGTFLKEGADSVGNGLKSLFGN